jgi:acyl-CoA thioesterase-2
MSSMKELVDVLTLEQIEVNLFRGQSPKDEVGRIFGGQVIAQALLAAYATVEGRICHSLQAYFIRPGDPTIPVLYEAERSRDGKSFTTRRVIAIQRGEQILNLAASFQVEEQGFEHQTEAPEARNPDDLPSDADRWIEAAKRFPERFANVSRRERAIELRSDDHVDWFDPKPAPARQRVWFRARQPVQGVAMNQAVLAYASDMSLLGTSMRPHGVTWFKGGVQTASLDHILWFHRPVHAHEWHLYDQDSPSASGARGFNRGSIYAQDGRLVASVAQEGLIRPR